MKIVVIGGSGLIGTKLVKRLRQHGHEVVAASPISGVNTITGDVRRFLSANQDARQVTTDVHARYFGVELNNQSLTPGDDPRIATTRFEDWLSHSTTQK